LKDFSCNRFIALLIAFTILVPFTLYNYQVFATIAAGGLMTKPNTDIYVSKGVYPTIGGYNTTFGAQTESYYDSFWVGKVNPADGSLIDWYWGKDRLTGNYDVTTGKVTFKAPVYRDLIPEPTYLTFEGYFYKYTQPSTFDPINFTTEFNFIDGIWNSSDDSGGWHSFVVYIKSK
jgi:hypothetical protein